MSIFKKKKEGGELEGAPEVRSVNPMVILACIVILAAIATYVVPAGTFDRVPIEGTEYEGIVQGSFHYVENSPIAPFNVFISFNHLSVLIVICFPSLKKSRVPFKSVR